MQRMNTTTRRFPRSSAEAFAHERYVAIEHHRAPVRISGWAYALALACAALFIAVQVAR